MKEQEAAVYMKQLLAAIAYCHGKRVVHRDVKPQNILLESKDLHAKVKLIDFGTSKLFEAGEKITLKIGTPYFIAPEVLRQSYTEKCDIWSCGVIMYLLLSGHVPFNGRNNQEVFYRIRIGQFAMAERTWDNISMEAKDLISKLLLFDPLKRISAQEALTHEWFNKHAQDSPVNSRMQKLALEELRNFRAQHKLQQAALTYIVTQLTTKKEKEALEKIFLSLDKTKRGRLNKDDLISGFKQVYGEGYPAEDEVAKVMQTVDIDQSGTIDYSEFVMATINVQQLLSQERLKLAFQLFDKDKNGKISVKEVKEVLGGEGEYPDNLWKEVIKEADKDNDGEISYEEFNLLMQKLFN